MELNTKKCTKCGIEKCVSDFHKSSWWRDGLAFYCKKCVSEYRREYDRRDKSRQRHREYQGKRRATPGGWALNIWSRLCAKQRIRKIKITVTKEQFIAWAVPRFEAFRTEYPNATPSLELKDAEGHVGIDNLRIVDRELRVTRSKLLIRALGITRNAPTQDKTDALIRALRSLCDILDVPEKEAFQLILEWFPRWEKFQALEAESRSAA